MATLRVGFVTAAHLHVWSYIRAMGHRDIEFAGVWDHNEPRGREFAQRAGIPYLESRDAVIEQSDAVAIVSENRRHAEDIEAVLAQDRHLICEKPIATTHEEVRRILDARTLHPQPVAMTAFPCRYSPSYQKLKTAIKQGQIGAIRAIMATNRGSCPHGWFTDLPLSGGGAMIDHTVHVSDLLLDLLPAPLAGVHAQTGRRMYAQPWDDSALVTLNFADGVFATIDSSWSRPEGYRTWGDVMMTVVGDGGVIEMDMFGQEVQLYTPQSPNHRAMGYGSDLDGLLVDEFLTAIAEGRPGRTSLEDGIAAAQVAIAAYESARARSVVALAA